MLLEDPAAVPEQARYIVSRRAPAVHHHLHPGIATQVMALRDAVHRHIPKAVTREAEAIQVEAAATPAAAIQEEVIPAAATPAADIRVAAIPAVVTPAVADIQEAAIRLAAEDDRKLLIKTMES